jgi:hypothetical protein
MPSASIFSEGNSLSELNRKIYFMKISCKLKDKLKIAKG